MFNIEDRTIRIFISSTFEDMKAERDCKLTKRGSLHNESFCLRIEFQATASCITFS